MPIWLKGVGRSSKELSRILNECGGGNDSYYRYRRAHSRHTLTDAYGELVYIECGVESRFPCQVLEISVGGCSLETEQPFRYGALAPIEVVLPILGMVLHIAGVTQWVKRDSLMGIHFRHANCDSQSQLRSLVDCLLGRRSVESVRESIGSRKLSPAFGDVLAVQSQGLRLASSSLPPLHQSRSVYDRSVHCGEGRLYPADDSDWPVVFHAMANRLCLTGSIVDLSLGGCTIRATKPFFGDINEPIEVQFRIEGRSFLLSGVTMALYDAHCLGVQFDAMNCQLREELALLLTDLCRATKSQLEVA